MSGGDSYSVRELNRLLTELEAVVCFGHADIGFERSDIVYVQSNSLPIPLLACAFAGFFAGTLRFLKVGLVDGETELLRHQHRQIDRETVGVVESPHIGSSELSLAGGLCCCYISLEELLSTIKRPGERFLLFIQNLLKICKLALNLREEVALRSDKKSVSWFRKE